MTRVSVSALKANLSRYLREVRRGGEVEILDRGVPVARLSALSPRGRDADDRRERLIRAGVIRPGKGNASAVLEAAPIKLGTSLLEALEDERADRV